MDFCGIHYQRIDDILVGPLPVASFFASEAMELSLTEKAVFLTARAFGGISLLSCLCTGLESWADWSKNKESSIVSRIQVQLQFPLSLYAIATMFGTSLAPKGEVWLARGNEMTCTTQGVALLFAVTSGVLLDASLSLSYLLIVKYGWEEQRLRKIEPFLYGFLWPFAMAISSYSFYNGMFGHVYETCFLRVPQDCNDSSIEECKPTPNGLATMRLTLLFINMFHLCFSIYVVIQICQFAIGGSNSRVARLVAIKGLLYALAVSVAQISVAVWVIIYFATGHEADGVGLVTTTVLPLMGFLNMLVFMLNRRKMNTMYGGLVRRLIDGIVNLFSCCSQQENDGTYNVDEEHRVVSEEFSYT